MLDVAALQQENAALRAQLSQLVETIAKLHSVKPSARLTFLMTVLGAPLNEAPWLAYQLSLLLERRSLVQAFEPAQTTTSPKSQQCRYHSGFTMSPPSNRS